MAIAIVAVGAPAAWMSYTECRNTCDPATPAWRLAKGPVVEAMGWDLLGAYLAAAVAFLGQQVAAASFGSGGDTLEPTPRSATPVLLIIAASATGVTGRALINRVGAHRVISTATFRPGTQLPMNARRSPKTRALAQMGSRRDNWMSDCADKQARRLSSVPCEQTANDVKAYLRARHVNSLLHAMSISDRQTVNLNSMDRLIDAIARDPTESNDSRIRHMAIVMLENDGAQELDRMAKKAEAEAEAAAGKATVKQPANQGMYVLGDENDLRVE